MSEQSYRLGHTTAIYLHPRYHEYASKLTATLPRHLRCVYLTNSGSEATELALQLARLCTGRAEIVALKNCYHGGTGVAAATTTMACYRYPLPPLPGHLHVSTASELLFFFFLFFLYFLFVFLCAPSSRSIRNGILK